MHLGSCGTFCTASLGDMAALTDKAKAAIDRLGVDELRYEIELGNASRFQREKYAYLKVRLAELEKAQVASSDAEPGDHAKRHSRQIESDQLAEFLTQGQKLRERLTETPPPIEDHNRWLDRMNVYFRERDARSYEARLSDFSGMTFLGDGSEGSKMSRSIEGRSRRLHEFISELAQAEGASRSGDTSAEKNAEVLLLRPSWFGIGIDLRAIWSWIRRNWGKRDSA